MYGIFDIVLDSDNPLPELSVIEAANAVSNVRLGIDTSRIPTNITWIHHWGEPDNGLSMSCAKLDNSYLLRFPKSADFIISGSGESIDYFPEPGVAPETIRHLLLDQVIPRILGQQGRLVLHASAVAMPDGAVAAFIGASGYGKSTLAASFHQSGATLITDDCLLLDMGKGQVTGIPNYYGVRLLDDSTSAIFGKSIESSPVAHYSDKSRLLLPRKEGHETYRKFPLQALFVLETPENIEDRDEISIEPLNGSRQLMSIVEQSFLLDVTDKLLVRNNFLNIGRLATSNIHIYSLKYPRKHELLSKVRSCIVDAL